MILFTFRSVSFLSVLGLFGFIFFGPEASTSLNKDLADAEIKHNRFNNLISRLTEKLTPEEPKEEPKTEEASNE